MSGTTHADASGTGPALTPEEARAQLPIRPGAVVLLLAVSAFVMILQETIVTVALQHLSADLGVTAGTIQWLVSGFLLTMGVVIPTTGYLLQRYTPRQMFLASMSLFTLGTVVCAAAPGFPVLLTGRVIQAVGTALIIPLLMTTIMNIVPAERRGSTMGTISIVIAVAPAVGPTVGGLVLETLNWRWMFGIVVPLAIGMLLLGYAFLRLDSETRSTPLDLLSVVLSALAFGGIVYGFSSLEHGGGSGVPPWAPLVLGAVALVVFVLRQRRLQRSDAALLDLRPFGHYQFSVCVILGALVFMALLGAGAVLLPIYLQTVIGVGADVTGLAVLPGGILLAILGKPVGWVFDRIGPRPLMIPGAIGLTAALWLFALLDMASIWPVIGVHMLLMGSLALLMTPLLAAALGALPAPLYSHGSAILTTLQQVAGAAAIAALVTFASLASASADGTPDESGLRAAFMAAGAIGILAVIISLLLRGGAARDEKHEEEGPDDTRPDDTRPAHRSEATALHGRVRSASGPPRAVITLIDPNGAQRGHVQVRDGEFALELPSTGTWYVVVSAPGHQPRADRVVVDRHDAGGTLRHEVDLVATDGSRGSPTGSFRRPGVPTS